MKQVIHIIWLFGVIWWCLVEADSGGGGSGSGVNNNNGDSVQQDLVDTYIKPKKIQIVYIKVPLALKSTKSSSIAPSLSNSNSNNNNNNGIYQQQQQQQQMKHSDRYNNKNNINNEYSTSGNKIYHHNEIASKGNHFVEYVAAADTNLGEAYNAATRQAIPYGNVRPMRPASIYQASIGGVQQQHNQQQTPFGKPMKNNYGFNGFGSEIQSIYSTNLESNYDESKKNNKQNKLKHAMKNFINFGGQFEDEFNGDFNGHMPPIDPIDAPMAFDMSGMSLAPMKSFGGMNFGKSLVMPSFGFGGIKNKLTSLLTTKLGGGVMTSILGMMGW